MTPTAASDMPGIADTPGVTNVLTRAVGRKLRLEYDDRSGCGPGMGLILAFGLSLALERYEARRQAVVDDANTIGTAYLRAQTLPEPMRSQSLALLKRYTDTEIKLSHVVPGSAAFARTFVNASSLQRPLWTLAARAAEQQPTATAPRLYEESLNDMIDQQTVRSAGLTNRVPPKCCWSKSLAPRSPSRSSASTSASWAAA